MSTNLFTGNAAPGVHVGLNTGQIARPAQPETASTFFTVIYSGWGPIDVPITVTSWLDCAQTFGSLHPNSPGLDSLYAYFNFFPGDRAVVCRVVGAAAVVATVTVQDRGVGAAQKPTLRIDAKYPSSTVDVRVTLEAGTNANTFKLTVRSLALRIKEVFDNLKVDAASIARVNQDSKLVKLTNLNSTNAAPVNLPTLAAEALLAGGDDDFASIDDARFIGTDVGGVRTGLQTFNSDEWGTGTVAIPGVTTAATHAALIAHAEAFKRWTPIDEALGSDKEDAVATRNLYGTNHGSLYWPWVDALDFAGSGLRKFYPPSGFAAGACAKADREVGTHKAPANYVIPGALDVERYPSGTSQTDEATRAYLNQNEVNVITPLPQQGVKIYGARVMTGDNRVQMVHEIRTLNLLYYQLKRTYQSIPFSVVDSSGRLFREVRSLSESYLRSLWRAGALYGETEEEAFIVICDRTNNTPETLDAQQVHVQVGVRLSPTAEMVIVDIDNVPLTQDLSVLQQ
jgi:phage tail sheath protein FI